MQREESQATREEAEGYYEALSRYLYFTSALMSKPSGKGQCSLISGFLEQQKTWNLDVI